MNKIEWVGGGHCNSTHNTRQNWQKIEAKENMGTLHTKTKNKNKKMLKLTW